MRFCMRLIVVLTLLDWVRGQWRQRLFLILISDWMSLGRLSLCCVPEGSWVIQWLRTWWSRRICQLQNRCLGVAEGGQLTIIFDSTRWRSTYLGRMENVDVLSMNIINSILWRKLTNVKCQNIWNHNVSRIPPFFFLFFFFIIEFIITIYFHIEESFQNARQFANRYFKC